MVKINKAVYFNSSRHEMLRFIPSDAMKILEVGCSDGSFARSLLKEGREIWGIEMNEIAAKEAKAVCNQVLVGDFDKVFDSIPKNYFDCVIFNDVLEHIYSPWEVLRKVKKILTSHGVMVTSIPNFRFIANVIEVILHGEFRYRPEGGILDDTHIRFFTQKSILRTFTEEGYELVVQKGINRRMDWKMLLILILSFGKMKDMAYRQFATVVRLK